MTTIQKIAVALSLCVAVAFFAYRTYRDGVPPAFPQRMETAASPTVSVSVTASVSVSVVAARTEPPAPSSAPTGDAVLDSMNVQRSLAGVPSLASDVMLRSMAQAHAADMARRGYFSHTTPEGATFEVRLRAGGYSGALSAENIGLTSRDPSDVVSGWMGSEGHRTNLLNPQYADVGIGSAEGVWQGVSVTFVVAVFGDGK